jgi:hypothetical protein
LANDSGAFRFRTAEVLEAIVVLEPRHFYSNHHHSCTDLQKMSQRSSTSKGNQKQPLKMVSEAQFVTKMVPLSNINVSEREETRSMSTFGAMKPTTSRVGLISNHNHTVIKFPAGFGSISQMSDPSIHSVPFISGGFKFTACFAGSLTPLGDESQNVKGNPGSTSLGSTFVFSDKEKARQQKQDEFVDDQEPWHTNNVSSVKSNPLTSQGSHFRSASDGHWVLDDQVCSLN